MLVTCILEKNVNQLSYFTINKPLNSLNSLKILNVMSATFGRIQIDSETLAKICLSFSVNSSRKFIRN